MPVFYRPTALRASQNSSPLRRSLRNRYDGAVR